MTELKYDSTDVESRLRAIGLDTVSEFIIDTKDEFDKGALTDSEAFSLIANHAFHAGVLILRDQLETQVPLLKVLREVDYPE